MYEKHTKKSPECYSPARKAMVFMYMGKPNSAFDWMNVAYKHRDYIMT